MTLSSRKLAVMFAFVFVLGAVAGGLVSANYADMRFYHFLNRANNPAALAHRLDTKLAVQYHLDDAEQARIAPLTREMARNLYELRQKFGTDVLAAIDASHAKIAAQMNPEHRAAYEKDNLDRHQRAASVLMAPSPANGADGNHS